MDLPESPDDDAWLTLGRTALHAGHTQAACRCDVLTADPDGSALRLCATALGTIVRAGAR